MAITRGFVIAVAKEADSSAEESKGYNKTHVRIKGNGFYIEMLVKEDSRTIPPKDESEVEYEAVNVFGGDLDPMFKSSPWKEEAERFICGLSEGRDAGRYYLHASNRVVAKCTDDSEIYNSLKVVRAATGVLDGVSEGERKRIRERFRDP